MNTNLIAIALEAVTEAERVLDAAFDRAVPGTDLTEEIRACSEAKKAAIAAGASGTDVMLAASKAIA